MSLPWLKKSDAPQIQQALYHRLRLIDPALPPWKTQIVRVSKRDNILIAGTMMIAWSVLETLQVKTLETLIATIDQLTEDAGRRLIAWLQRPDKQLAAFTPWTAEAFTMPDPFIDPEIITKLRADLAIAHDTAWDAVQAFAGGWGGELEASTVCTAPPPTLSATWSQRLYVACPECSLTQSYALADLSAAGPAVFTRPGSIAQSLTAAWRRVAEAARNTPAWQALRAALSATADIATTPDVLWQPNTLQAFAIVQTLSEQSTQYAAEALGYTQGQWTLVTPPDTPKPSKWQTRLASAQQTIASDPRLSVAAAEATLHQLWETDGRPRWEAMQAQWQAAPPVVQHVPAVHQSFEALSDLAKAWQHPNLQSSREGIRLNANTPALPTLSDLVSRFCDQAQALVTQMTTISRRLPPVPVFQAIVRVLNDHPRAMGVTTLAALLAGSTARKLRNQGYDSHPAYGAFHRVYCQTQLIAWIRTLVECDGLRVIAVGVHRLPVLKLSKALASGTSSGVLSPADPSDPSSPPLATLIGGKRWEAIAEQAPADWAAEVALRAAALLWPTGQAAQLKNRAGLAELRPQG